MASGETLADTVKAVHRRFPTGVTIVTAQSEGRPYGLAVNAFSSVSIEPPVVLLCVAASSSTHPHLFRVDHVGVNILGEAQQDLLQAFARSGGEKFVGVEWSPGPHGSPILAGAAASLELEIERRLPAYTHTVMTGRIVMAEASSNSPLVYLGGELYESSTLRPLDQEAAR